MIRFIRGSREAMNKKRKFDCVGDQSSHGGSWDRNGSRFGGGRDGHGGGRDSQNGGGRGGRGGNGPATSASVVLTVSAATTSTTSAAKYGTVPVPGSPMGFITDAVKFSFLIHCLP